MKRDLDLLRDILLFIEEQDQSNWALISEWGDLYDIEPRTLNQHIQLLNEAEFIEIADISDVTYDGQRLYPKRITMAGYDYLDNVRDPKIWKATKKSLQKLGGSASLPIIQKIAIREIKKAVGL